ncbi:MAG: MMPL family transporter, partial [Acidimicrobiia bacterium]|nr:MMPL family transporter [Acidimicrobiia bacterium]
EIRALERISEEFAGDGSGSVFQVVVREPGGDVIDADGLNAVLAIEETIREEAGEILADDAAERPAVSSYLSPVVTGAQFAGQDPAQMAAGGDEAVDGFLSTALGQTPPDQVSLLQSLVSEGSDLEGGSAEAGLVLAFFTGGNESTEAFTRQIEIEQAIEQSLGEIDSEAEIRPFSVSLLQGGTDNLGAEVGRLFGMAAAIIVAILMIVYWMPVKGNATWTRVIRRAIANMAITMLAILLAIAMAQGLGYLLLQAGVINSFNPVTQIVPVLIIGLGVDYAIHLTSRYQEEVGSGSSVDEGMSRAVGTVGVTLFLATITTAIGFLTNVVSPVPALSDFGILTAIGIVVAFLLTLTFVPALRLLFDRRASEAHALPTDGMEASEGRVLPRLVEKTSILAENFAVATLVIALVAAGLGFWGFRSLNTEFSFTDFLPEDSPMIQTSEILAEEFGGGFGEQTQVLITAPEGESLATGAVHNALIDANGQLSEIDDVSVVDVGGQSIINASSPYNLIAQELMNPEGAPGVSAEAEGAGMGPDLTVAEDADLTSLYQALLEAKPEEAGAVVSMENGRVGAMLWDIQTTAGEDDAGGLRAALADAFANVEAVGATVVPTSQNIVGDVVIESLTSSQTSSLVVTILASTLVVMISFWFENRRPMLGVLTMLPVAMVVLWTYGLMYVFGIPFGPVTATLAALAVGIGVPYTIHIARRFEEDRKRFADLNEAIRSTTRHTGSALAGSALTTMAGFGILMTSSLTPFRQMGQITFFAIALAMLSAIAVLPAILYLWEGWHRKRSPAITDGGLELQPEPDTKG